MGGTGRRTPFLALDRADRLSDGTVDRRPHPQPADDPRTGLHLLLPQDGPDYAQRRSLRHARRGRHPAGHQRHHHALLGLHRSDGRCFLRQHAGASGQFGHDGLRTGAHRRSRMGLVGDLPARQNGVEHHPAQHDDDSGGLLLLRLRNDPRRGQSPDEQQQPRQPPRPALAAQPRPVRRPPTALRRLLLGPALGLQVQDALLSGRRRQV